LGLGRLLRVRNVRREVRRRGEMQWALWRIPFPLKVNRARRGRVLWIPGWGDTPLSWLPLAVAVTARKGFEELVVLDFPGFHGSLAHSRCITEMDRFFDISCDVARELKPEILVGHSLGGWLSARAAIELETPPEKLVLMAPSGICGGKDERQRWRSEFELFVSSSNATEYGNRLFAEAPAWWGRLGSLFVPFLSREDTREFLGSVQEHHFLDEGLRDKLSRLAACEIELLWGEKDQIVPARFAEHWSKSLPHSKVTLWQDVGHMPQVETPVRVYRWLNGIFSA